MKHVQPSLRLMLCGILIFVSAIYAVLVARDPSFASALASGYVALVITIFLLVNVWKNTQ